VVELWRADVRSGRRDSLPRQSQLDALAARFEWEARSRVVEEGDGRLAGVALLSAVPSPDGPLAQIDASATTDDTLQELMRWGLGLSRASGAITAMSWVGRGHGEPLRELGLNLARPWWRMDRSLATELPEPRAVPGYLLLDGRTVQPGAWADLHNRTFADHWRFSYRSEAELIGGKVPELSLMVVTADGEPVALTLCDLETFEADPRPQPVGVVRSVGTVPAHRRRGIATWLVAEALARLHRGGARHASLYVDAMNQTRAYDAYEKLGFKVAFEAEVWEATHP